MTNQLKVTHYVCKTVNTCKLLIADGHNAEG